jgi:putative restriction endonuclease
MHDVGIHKATVKGIAAQGEAIVLSDGYVDDEDFGDEIIYTGDGGRDPNTGKQVKDQKLTHGNKYLVKNYINGLPIRVSRGHQLESNYSPKSGYRYEGLYRIDEYWSEEERDGFLIWRFRLNRLEGQTGIGELEESSDTDEEQKTTKGNEKPERATSTVSRVIRNTQIGNDVKRIHNHTCQICHIRINTPSGPYAECCHIKPLGRPHNGPDTLDNVLCLCPNCHVLLDMYALHINEELTIVETGEKLTVIDEHNINIENIRYHLNLSIGIDA